MHIIAKTLATAFALALLGATAAPASAAVVEHRHFVDSGTDRFDCDGIDTAVSWRNRIHELIRTRGPDGLVYFSAGVHGRSVFTNLDTGGTYTGVYNYTDRDLKIVDNGDGTLTIIAQSAGSTRWYDSDGTVVLKDTGLFRFVITIDHGGTPTDPSDDQEISFEIVKHAGLNDTADRDFCEDLALFT